MQQPSLTDRSGIKKPKHFTFLVGPALGHVTRIVSVVNEIVKISDAHITLISPDTRPYLARLAPDNCNVRMVVIEQDKPGFMSFAPSVEKYFDENPCDLIILDMDPLNWISTTRFPEIPQVYITNIFLTRLSDRSTFQKVKFRSLSNEINKIRRHKKLDELTAIEEIYERDLILLADPLNVIGLHDRLPNNYLPVGPCSLDEGDTELPKELLSLDNVLLISFGSTGDINLVQPAIEVLLEHHHFEAIIWVGEKPECADFTDAPVTYVYPWLPLKALLPKTKLVITHGGTGSTYQALEAGKPVVCCPHLRNHIVLSALIEELGLGVSVENSLCLEKLSRLDLDALQARVKSVAAGNSFGFGPGTIANSLLEMATAAPLAISANQVTTRRSEERYESMTLWSKLSQIFSR